MPTRFPNALDEAWEAVSEEECRDLMRYMVEAVYADPLNERIVALKPKPAFLPLFALCGALEEKDGLFGPSLSSSGVWSESDGGRIRVW